MAIKIYELFFSIPIYPSAIYKPYWLYAMYGVCPIWPKSLSLSKVHQLAIGIWFNPCSVVIVFELHQLIIISVYSVLSRTYP